MNKRWLVLLAASSLGGCASWTQPTAGITHSVVSFVQRVTAGAPPAQPARPESGDARFRAVRALALGGDRDAMVELATMLGRGSNGVAQDERARIEWLRRASALQHAGASYQLYLHYLERGLDRDALRYEALALRQGYVIPPRLDPRRGGRGITRRNPRAAALPEAAIFR
jgi:TPR repeat protein